MPDSILVINGFVARCPKCNSYKVKEVTDTVKSGIECTICGHTSPWMDFVNAGAKHLGKGADNGGV